MHELFDLSQVFDLIKTRGIQNIDLKFSNLFGGWHHLTLPAKSLSEALFDQGVGFDSSSVAGFLKLECGDMCLLPEVRTGFIDPFWEMPTLSFICNIVEADTKLSFYRDPRSIAMRAEKYLVDSGIADLSIWGPEFEYYIFDSVRYSNETNICFYEIKSTEARSASLDTGSAVEGIVNPIHGGYHAIPPKDKFFDIRSETAQLLEEAGIAVNYHHHEVGAPGQNEIEVIMGPLTRMGDKSQMVKYFIKMVARKRGKVATFMPKPLFNEAGNGMHFHQALYLKGGPLFYDQAGYGGLSRLAHHYIGGILKHAPALLALTNPSTNSYRRLVPGFEAPVNAFYSLANRSAAIRIPKYAHKPDQKRMEFRPPDATCNPYIAMAAMLMAGIDGIKRQIDPTTEGFGPYDENVFEWSHQKRQEKIKSLPTSLAQALQALEEDHAFLMEGDVFTDGIIRTWIDFKTRNECQAVDQRPHPFEVELYFNT